MFLFAFYCRAFISYYLTIVFSVSYGATAVQKCLTQFHGSYLQMNRLWRTREGMVCSIVSKFDFGHMSKNLIEQDFPIRYF